MIKVFVAQSLSRRSWFYDKKIFVNSTRCLKIRPSNTLVINDGLDFDI